MKTPTNESVVILITSLKDEIHVLLSPVYFLMKNSLLSYIKAT